MEIEGIPELPAIYFQILRLWELGLTGSQIGKQVGLTRSAVMGVLYRMRMKGIAMRNPEKEKAEKTLKDALEGRKPKRKTKPKPTKAANTLDHRSVKVSLPWHTKGEGRRGPRPVRVASVRGDEVDIMRLSLFTCRYINGEVDGLDTLYCGKRVERGVYCAEHAKLCYAEPYEKRRANNAATQSALAG